MYKIIVERRATKEIESLPDNIIQKIIDTIKSLRASPRPHGVKKLLGEIGWRIRVGSYRILYTIDDGKKVVTVYRIKHRREAYR